MSRGCRAIDGTHHGVGQRRAQDPTMQHAGKRYVDGEGCCARDLGTAILPRYRFANYSEKSIRGQRCRLSGRNLPCYFT
jgi:hypothetical protein